MDKNNTASIGFEKQIWDAACVLRGNIDASEYKSVVLGLIFLKYISDRFEEKYQELLAEGDGFEEDIDEYTSEGIFFVPANARWSVIASKAHTPEIGTVIDDAMRAIEKENKRLKDILPKNFARPELDKRRLGDVVDLFTNIQMIDDGSEKDILGNTYQYCLRKFAENEAYEIIIGRGLFADSDLYSREGIRAKMRNYALKPIMSARTSILAQTQRTERNIKVVRNDKNIFNRDLQFIHPVSHSLTAEIHIGRRFQKMKLPALE